MAHAHMIRFVNTERFMAHLINILHAVHLNTWIYVYVKLFVNMWGHLHTL